MPGEPTYLLKFRGGFVYCAMPMRHSLSIFAGGGVALLYATKVLENLQARNADQRRGVQIVQNALKVPFWLSYEFQSISDGIFVLDILDGIYDHLGTYVYHCLECWR